MHRQYLYGQMKSEGCGAAPAESAVGRERKIFVTERVRLGSERERVSKRLSERASAIRSERREGSRREGR